MEYTSWNGPDVCHLSWHGPAVPALAQTLTFPWPEHSAQLNSEARLSPSPYVLSPVLCQLCSVLSQLLALETPQAGSVSFSEVYQSSECA